jgi:hypothetical protein
MERTVLKCSLGLILNNFYTKSWSWNRPLKNLIHVDDDDDEILHKHLSNTEYFEVILGNH